MFAKLSLLALVLPLVSALTLHVPPSPTSQSTITITWDTAAGDPETFTIELVNQAFNDKFAIANNVDPAQGSITLQLPVVPARDGYTLEAVNIGNINDVYSTTPAFSIGESTASVTSASASSTSHTSATRSGSVTTTGTTTRATLTTGDTTIATRSATVSGSQTRTSDPSITNLSSGASSSKAGVFGAALAGVAAAAFFAL